MNAESLPKYSIHELNEAIGTLLDRGFAPRFLIQALVSKPQLKKGHLWLTLSDGEASINAVIWASKLKQIAFHPQEGDGVIVIGKLNFWKTRATLNIHVLDIRPSLSTVIRQFEIVRSKLEKEGLINNQKAPALPKSPRCIAILTSVPSSALADMLRTAKERWPMTKLVIIPIPVQGKVSKEVTSVLHRLAKAHTQLGVQAIVIARGGGSREDLMLFDNESLCREIANFPVPVITGLGHEDDITVADFVADYRASTPTAAIVALLNSKEAAFSELLQRQHRLKDNCNWLIKRQRELLMKIRTTWTAQSLYAVIQRNQVELSQKLHMLEALSPQRWLKTGFSIVQNHHGKAIRSINEICMNKDLTIIVSDGEIQATPKEIQLKEKG